MAVFSILTGCQRAAAPAGPRTVAILPFENLTGRAELDWLAGGIQQVLVAQLGQAAGLVLTGPQDLRTAIQTGAREVWHGTVTPGRSGRVRIELSREDRETGKITSPAPLEAPVEDGLFAGLSQVAAAIGGGVPARAYPTGKVEALKEYMAGRTATDAAAALAHYQRATEIDPRFSNAWLSRAELTANLRQPEEALRLLDEFQKQVPGAPEVEKAQAAMIAAEAKGDRTAAALALKRLAAASPWNTTVQATAANTFNRLRWNAEAAEVLTRLTKIQPGDGDHWNQLAYARAGQGDLAGARAALEEYRKLEPANLNVLDSQGEIEYRFGNFAKAADSFQETYTKNAAFLEGAGLGKAAYARLMAGDLKTADERFGQLLQYRRAAGPQQAEALLRANWLFQTGRRAEAFRLIGQAPADAPPALRAAYETEGCLMHAAARQWDAARAAAQRALTGGAPPTGRAMICFFLAQPEAPAEEWTRRADRMFPAPAPPSLRATALGYALALRGHCAAAMAPLRQVLEATDPAADGEPRTLLAHCAVETKQWDAVKDLFTQWPQPPTVEPLFTPLVFPFMIDVRARVEQHYERAEGVALCRKLYAAYTR